MFPLRVPVLALLAVAVMAGCAQLPLTARERDQTNPNAFEAQGRVYVRFGARAFSGTLRWRHDDIADEVWLGGPLGQTAAHIVRDSTGAALTTADQQTYRARSIESLTREGLGWTLPLTDLSYYIVDQVPPTAKKVLERDTRGLPLRVEHSGWLVQWQRPEAPSGAAVLPRLNLIKDDVEIRLVVDQLGSAE